MVLTSSKEIAVNRSNEAEHWKKLAMCRKKAIKNHNSEQNMHGGLKISTRELKMELRL